MNRLVGLLVVALVALLAFGALISACSSRRLPPGTPPPEYEVPVVPPWSPGAGDAGLPSPISDSTGEIDAAAPPPREPAVSGDAGSR